MTIAQALAALVDEARALSDAGAAAELLARAAAIADDAALVPSREGGLALLDIASALVAHGDPRGVEGLFGSAQRVLAACADLRMDDQLLLWNNLSALYDRHGAFELRDPLVQQIGRVALDYTGPLDHRGIRVLVEWGMIYRQRGLFEPMLVMMRQVHRHRGDPAQPAEDRRSWLEIYANLLRKAGHNEEAAPVLEQAAALARAAGDAVGEASRLNDRARLALTAGDFGAATTALERAREALDDAGPPAAESLLAAAVLHNLVAARLSSQEAGRHAETLRLAGRAIALLRRQGRADSDDFARALYHRAVLLEKLGDWRAAAGGYAEAAALPGAAPETRTDWLTLAGRAWFEACDYDAASTCYLAAVRRRVAAASPA